MTETQESVHDEVFDQYNLPQESVKDKIRKEKDVISLTK